MHSITKLQPHVLPSPSVRSFVHGDGQILAMRPVNCHRLSGLFTSQCRFQYFPVRKKHLEQDESKHQAVLLGYHICTHTHSHLVDL